MSSNDENKNLSLAPPSGLGNPSKLTKEIEQEAANWFMRFMEKDLEKRTRSVKARVMKMLTKIHSP
ncbi:unnamed protein product [Brassica oleracea var. botrytis]|uniref:BnaCnng45120D protein n=2 Tax=Brassica napus TaxID=3708 RepID=A0A078JB90_BRANA|nr:hypothetical protein HID58_092804 [Brassica napus]CAF1958975.1 unnamed protein product [Brassica napus]CDY64823.1 BnaCnng45120D [Brassica napus]